LRARTPRTPVSDLACRGADRCPLGRSLGSGVYHACFGKSGIDLGHALIRDDVWMFGHRPIGQVLDGVDVLFFYESPAHVGPNLAGYREGSTSGHTFHRVN